MDNEQAIADALVKALKAAGTTPGTNYAHGPGGIFSQPGMRPQVVNAMVMPFGLGDMLPAKRSVYANEVYPILTGQTAATGTNPETACGDCKKPGNLKVCNQTWPFGRWCMDSQVLQLDRLGLLVNRSEFVDQTLIGNPFAMAEQPAQGEWNPAEALRNEKGKQLMQLFVDWKRTFAPLFWTGNPANNTGSGNTLAYGEPYGMQGIVNSGYKDTYTNQLCSAADPLVQAFSANVEADAGATVRLLVELYNRQKYLAERTGLAPVKFAYVMRYGAFRKLTEIWPCAYYTYRCTVVGNNSTNFIDAGEQVRLRDDMRQNNYLLIDGEQVPVVVDATLPETISPAGTAISDIYLIALSSPKFSHNPNSAILYWEFFDMRDPVALAQQGLMAYPANTFQVLGGGRYLVYPKAPSNVCIQYGMLSRERLIHEAPFLNARITDVSYTFTYHEREWNPNSPYYFYDGGQYSFAQPYFYPPN